MDSKKIVVLSVAVVAIGIFALPSTVSLFAGQHVWYDLGASIEGASGRNNVPCEKCHADIADEMSSGANGVHRNLTCAMCHRAPFTDYTYARGHYYIGSGYYAPTPGKEVHAASMVECMDCHGAQDEGAHTSDREYVGRCEDCHMGIINTSIPGTGLAAGGFGLTPYSSDDGTKAAHKQFVLDAMDDTILKGSNEACVACHTHVAVKLNWTHAEKLEFTATRTSPQTTGAHNWTLSNWSVSGTVNVTVWGNTTGAGNTNYTSDWPGNVDNIYH